MNQNRRIIMKTAMTFGITGAVASSGLSAQAADVTDARLVHHVFFWLNNPGSAEDRALLIAGLKTLRRIDIIRSLHIGVPASTEKRDVVDSSYDVSELMLFDTIADQKSYQDHPVHKAFVAKCGHLWSRVLVYDAIAA
jgi:hypothetical protein